MSIGKNHFRRLHRRGGCWYTAVAVEEVDDLATARYNAKCHVCWKTGKQHTSKKLLVDLQANVESSVASESDSSVAME